MNAPDYTFTIECFRADTPKLIKRFFVWDCATEGAKASGTMDFEVRSTSNITETNLERIFNLKLERTKAKRWKIAWISSGNGSNHDAHRYEEVSGKGIPNFLLPEVARRFNCVIASIRSGSNVPKLTSDPKMAPFDKAAKASGPLLSFDGGDQQSESAAKMWRFLRMHLEANPCEFFVREDNDEHCFEMVRRADINNTPPPRMVPANDVPDS